MKNNRKIFYITRVIARLFMAPFIVVYEELFAKGSYHRKKYYENNKYIGCEKRTFFNFRKFYDNWGVYCGKCKKQGGLFNGKLIYYDVFGKKIGEGKTSTLRVVYYDDFYKMLKRKCK